MNGGVADLVRHLTLESEFPSPTLSRLLGRMPVDLQLCIYQPVNKWLCADSNARSPRMFSSLRQLAVLKRRCKNACNIQRTEPLFEVDCSEFG